MGGLKRVDETCATRLAEPVGEEVRRFIGAPGAPGAVFTTERQTIAPTFYVVADAFDANGNLLPIREMPLELRRAVSGMEVIIKNAAAGDGHTDRIHKIRF